MSEGLPSSGTCAGEKEELRAVRLHIRGVVQGVGFRPFVYRLAHSWGLAGWVLNGETGVEIHVEGASQALQGFLESLRTQPPPAARIAALDAEPALPQGFPEFVIRESRRQEHPTVRIAPDLPVCPSCLEELFDPHDRRCGYPYINCTDCGPRYSIILGLPYDRPQTTMKDWAMCPQCSEEYHDPADRRFHAQPVACPACGPGYRLRVGEHVVEGSERAIAEAARLLRDGAIVAVKGLGGYHLACDVRNPQAVWALRERKYRKEKPFALMVRDLDVARTLAELSPDTVALLTCTARPIVLCPARVELPGVAPENRDLGLMLPYTPLHYLLFAAGAPEALVMTSANRSSEPIAYRDVEALERLSGIAYAFLIGERPIARRVEDSVAYAGALGPVVLRHGRGYAPEAVTALPAHRPILAVGADLKNTVTLAVGGEAFVSQHIGDLDDYQAFEAFCETIHDLCRMYDVRMDGLLVVHDLHPEYASTGHARTLPGEYLGVQHHQAHIASVLAERGAWESRVVGIAFDGTGYGEDGAIWGGEIFVGGLAEGFVREGHLREAVLPGGDAAARFPVQAAAGFLAQLDALPDLSAPPFAFPPRYRQALELVRKGVRTFPTTSMGRLFDTVAALMGFTREISFEGQAAIWLEHLARRRPPVPAYPFPVRNGELDFRPLLDAVVADRCRGRDPIEIARAFHEAVAQSVLDTGLFFCDAHAVDTVILSGGVFQNALLIARVKALREERRHGPEIWLNQKVPPNDGGISLGQAAIAACASRTGVVRKRLVTRV
jgi:hydrogenase maturation protein HypF